MIPNADAEESSLARRKNKTKWVPRSRGPGPYRKKRRQRKKKEEEATALGGTWMKSGRE